MLYILWSPFTVKVYAGRTVNFRRRHTDHFHRIDNPSAAGQIPAYHVIRNLAPSGTHPASMYFMLPVAQVEGDRRDAVIWERAFIHGWAFKLNAPRVYHHVPLHVLRVLNPVKFGLRTGACAQTTVQLVKQAHGRRLSRTTRNRARALGAPIPQRHTQQSVFDKILAALSFEVRDRAAKHGLRLLYVLRSRALLAEIFKAVGRWASGDRLKAAKKHHVGSGKNPLVCADSKHWKHYDCFAGVLYIAIPVLVVSEHAVPEWENQAANPAGNCAKLEG